MPHVNSEGGDKILRIWRLIFVVNDRTHYIKFFDDAAQQRYDIGSYINRCPTTAKNKIKLK